MSLATTGLIANLLSSVKTDLDGGFLYIFSGTVPSTAGEALDTSSTHTLLVTLTLNADGATGLTFAAPTGNPLAKTSTETWSGLATFSGANASETELTPSFYRFCPSGDDALSEVTTPRIQGSVGGPDSTAELTLLTDTVTAASTVTVSKFQFRLNGAN